MKSRLGLYALTSFALAHSYNPLERKSKNDLRPQDIDITPKEAVIPNGCKEYYFNYLGEFINKNDGVYAFKCIAISDKSACKKFQKWVKSQTQI